MRSTGPFWMNKTNIIHLKIQDIVDLLSPLLPSCFAHTSSLWQNLHFHESVAKMQTETFYRKRNEVTFSACSLSCTACPTTKDQPSVLLANLFENQPAFITKQALISSQIKRVVLPIIHSSSSELVHVVVPPVLAGWLRSATNCSTWRQRLVGLAPFQCGS